jgi:NADH-quinone oxidoreductase subunit L
MLYGDPKAIITFTGRLEPLYEASLNKFYVDEFYEWFVARPTRAVAVICDFVDAYFVDGLVRSIAKIPRGVARNLLGKYQNGLIQFYAGASVLCVVVLLLVLLVLSP